jgi:hypothetical protein
MDHDREAAVDADVPLHLNAPIGAAFSPDLGERR